MSCYFLHGCVEANLSSQEIPCSSVRLETAVERDLLSTMTWQAQLFTSFPFVSMSSLRVVHWVRRKADKVRIQLPGTRIRDRTSFLTASLRFRQARFTFCRDFFLESDSALVRLRLTFWICNSSTNRLFPLDVRTQDVRSGLL